MEHCLRAIATLSGRPEGRRCDADENLFGAENQIDGIQTMIAVAIIPGYLLPLDAEFRPAGP